MDFLPQASTGWVRYSSATEAWNGSERCNSARPELPTGWAHYSWDSEPNTSEWVPTYWARVCSAETSKSGEPGSSVWCAGWGPVWRVCNVAVG